MPLRSPPAPLVPLVPLRAAKLRQLEVDHLQLAVRINDEVLRFDVAVANVPGVQEVDAEKHLPQQHLGFRFELVAEEVESVCEKVLEDFFNTSMNLCKYSVYLFHLI